jgi:adenylyltransferase/sulfurtransferase
MSYRTLKIRKDPNGEPITELIDYDNFCGAVSEEASEAVKDATISVKQLKDMIDGDAEDFFLVDVREPNEYEIVSIPGATLIPKGEFLAGSGLESLPQDKRTVIYCKTGIRSAEVLAVAKAAGFSDAVHVGGGVSAWVSQIEPDKPSY